MEEYAELSSGDDANQAMLGSLEMSMDNVEDSTDFVHFSIIIGIRFVLNLYTNNAPKLTPAQFDAYPFRIP